MNAVIGYRTITEIPLSEEEKLIKDQGSHEFYFHWIACASVKIIHRVKTQKGGKLVQTTGIN